MRNAQHNQGELESRSIYLLWKRTHGNDSSQGKGRNGKIVSGRGFQDRILHNGQHCHWTQIFGTVQFRYRTDKNASIQFFLQSHITQHGRRIGSPGGQGRLITRRVVVIVIVVVPQEGPKLKFRLQRGTQRNLGRALIARKQRDHRNGRGRAGRKHGSTFVAFQSTGNGRFDNLILKFLLKIRRKEERLHEIPNPDGHGNGHLPIIRRTGPFNAQFRVANKHHWVRG